ncbi:DUF4253 domain-containing protein [Streptomyces xanthochromogenes]|uniref:DUF4253 domain-containing protein n=1 Tax=Streptomyces xanthochromogenes TaxID=67384 RepID=UPI0034471DA6
MRQAAVVLPDGSEPTAQGPEVHASTSQGASLLRRPSDRYGPTSRDKATNPQQLASELAEAFRAHCPQIRHGLVAAPSGAEALTAVGRACPCNHESDTAKLSAVVRGWEHRFGARVVTVGFSTLHLGTATPPGSEHEALLVAAEHLAFCPDTIRQSSRPYTLAAYAERIAGAHRWDFWWD